MTFPLEKQDQCGGPKEQRWITQRFSTILRHPGGDSFREQAARSSWVEMANNRGYGGPNVMLMQTESSSTDTLVAMLASCSPVALQGV